MYSARSSTYVPLPISCFIVDMGCSVGTCRSSLVNVPASFGYGGQFAQMTGAHYPDTYETFVKRLHFINLDLGDMLSVSCFIKTDFFDRLVWKTLAPVAVLCALRATYAIASARNRNATSAVKLTFRRKHLSMAIFVLFFVYSSVSRDIFLVFSCESLDNGVSYLRADYGLTCSSRRHHVFRAYASLMAAVYPLGIPALFGWWLRRHRRDLQSADRSENPHLEPAKALWESYKGSRWYFIVIEYGRRIALTGLGVFIYPNSAAQVAILLLLAFGFSMLSEVLDPFETPIETWLYRSGSCVIFASMYAALLLKVDVSDENSESQSAFSAVLILSHVVLFATVFIQGVFALVHKWRAVREAEAEEEAERALVRAKFRDVLPRLRFNQPGRMGARVAPFCEEEEPVYILEDVPDRRPLNVRQGAEGRGSSVEPTHENGAWGGGALDSSVEPTHGNGAGEASTFSGSVEPTRRNTWKANTVSGNAEPIQGNGRPGVYTGGGNAGTLDRGRLIGGVDSPAKSTASLPLSPFDVGSPGA